MEVGAHVTVKSGERQSTVALWGLDVYPLQEQSSSANWLAVMVPWDHPRHCG